MYMIAPPDLPCPGRPALRRRAGAVLGCVAAALPAVLSAGCQFTPFLLSPGEAGLLLGMSALVNAAVVGAVLLVGERLLRRKRERAHLLRELRYFVPWGEPEGILRKTGLLHDLNALGVEAVPLHGAALAGAELAGLRLRGSRLRAADLRGADLQGTLLDGADLFGADLSGANLERASLRGADLRGANLEGASLSRSDLRRSNLRRAVMVDANLHGALLEGARLELAHFAQRQAGLFQPTVHPSVEDWVRERLDAQGRYSEPGAEADAEDGAAPERD